MAPRWIMLLLAAVLLGLTQRAEASSAEVAATASPGPKKSIGRCKNCVYVLERIKQGYHYLLPNICEEIMAKTGDNDEYATCHSLMSGLSNWGALVRQWLHDGCYKVEPYGSLSKVQPCPSHVICSKITDLTNWAFCDTVKTDFANAPAPKAGATPSKGPAKK